MKNGSAMKRFRRFSQFLFMLHPIYLLLHLRRAITQCSNHSDDGFDGTDADNVHSCTFPYTLSADYFANGLLLSRFYSHTSHGKHTLQ